MAWTIPLVGEWAYSWLFGAWNDAHTYQHKGLDFGTMGVTGLPVVSPTNMTIEYVGNDPEGYGNYVKGTTDDGLTIILGHLSSYIVNIGDVVGAGDLLGYSGNTGNSTGPHLHLEVREGGVPVDPQPYLTDANEPPNYAPDDGSVTSPGTTGSTTGNTRTISSITDVGQSIADFLTWIKELPYKRLAGNAVVMVGGVILVGIALYTLAQTQVAQTMGNAIGSALQASKEEAIE